MPKRRRLGKTGVKRLLKKRELKEEATEEKSIEGEKPETAVEAGNGEGPASEEDESSNGEAPRVAVEEHAREQAAMG